MVMLSVSSLTLSADAGTSKRGSSGHACQKTADTVKAKLFGVQGLQPHSSHNTHCQAALSDHIGGSWVFHSLLNSHWLFLSWLLVCWFDSGVCTGDLKLWPPQADHT